MNETTRFSNSKFNNRILMHIALLEITMHYSFYLRYHSFYAIISFNDKKVVNTVLQRNHSGNSGEEVIVGAAFLRPEARERNKWTIEAPQNPKGG